MRGGVGGGGGGGVVNPQGCYCIVDVVVGVVVGVVMDGHATLRRRNE